MSRRLALVLVGDVMLGRIVDESLTALPRQLHDGVTSAAVAARPRPSPNPRCCLPSA